MKESLMIAVFIIIVFVVLQYICKALYKRKYETFCIYCPRRK